MPNKPAAPPAVKPVDAALAAVEKAQAIAADLAEMVDGAVPGAPNAPEPPDVIGPPPPMPQAPPTEPPVMLERQSPDSRVAFRRRPVAVRAFQFRAERLSDPGFFDEIEAVLPLRARGHINGAVVDVQARLFGTGTMTVEFDGVQHEVAEGDWLVRDPDGVITVVPRWRFASHFAPIDSADFAASYLAPGSIR